MDRPYDREVEDLGNVVSLEHVNVLIPDQQLATLFYVAGLGLTRDPYLMTSTNNMWINIGRSQIHMPTGKPQVLRGHVGVVMPNREALLERLAKVKPHLKGTEFKFKEHNAYVEAVSPWGNRMRVFEPDEERFGKVLLGVPYVEFTVPGGDGEGHRPLLPRHPEDARADRGERRRARRPRHRRHRPGARFPRDRREDPGL
jgi:hypothetical protein